MAARFLLPYRSNIPRRICFKRIAAIAFQGPRTLGKGSGHLTVDEFANAFSERTEPKCRIVYATF